MNKKMNKIGKIMLITSVIAFILIGIFIIVIAMKFVNQTIAENLAIVLAWIAFALLFIAGAFVITGLILIVKANKEYIKEYFKRVK